MKKARNNLSLFPEEASTAVFDHPEEQQEKVLQGALEKFARGRRKDPTHGINLRMPYDIYAAFQAEIGRLHDEAKDVAPEKMKLFTMTNYINSAVRHVILPGLKRLSVSATKSEAA